MGDDLKIISLNVRGLSDFKKRRSIFNWCRKSQADLILLQETHSTDCVVNRWQQEWGGKILFSHGTSNSRGVAVVIRNGSNITINDVYHDDFGRILIIKGDKNDFNFTLTNLYAPNNEHCLANFYIDLKNIFMEKDLISCDNNIIGGDYNCILNVNLDKQGGNLKLKQQVVNNINALIDIFDLIDVWRNFHPTERRYTWRQNNPLIQCRLDYFLVSNNLLEYVTKTDINPGLRTDHSSILLKLKLQKNPDRGRGHWKFNNSYLNDDAYVNEIREKLTEWLQDPGIRDPQVKWEWIKFKVRDFSIRYAKQKCQQRRDKILDLTKKLNGLEKKLSSDPDAGVLQEIGELKQELEDLDAKVVDGIIVRARLRWAEKGERSNKYFLGLEKRNGRKKQCKKLILDDDVEVTNPSQILRLQSDFYEKIYKSTVIVNNDDNFLCTNNDIPSLSNEDRNSCEGDLSLAECFEVLNGMARNKTPGNDGISCEWYLKFWNIVGTFLVNVLNVGLQKGEMSSSQRQAVITLLEKEGKDRCKLKNWRPISLLNVDYKIASKVLATRLKKVIPTLVHQDQSGFVKGRYIGESVRSISDIMNFTKIYNKPGIMLFLDFEKAFDSLEWDFLFKTLYHMNFGESFVNSVKALYTNISSCVMNNGVSSKYFSVSRGVRQGDPLSPYLFILAIEPLSCKIRNDPNIHGISVKNCEIKIIQYADDTTCTLKDEQSVHKLFDVIDNFGIISGLKLNVSKSQALWLGSKRFCRDKPFNILWPDEPVKALGVYFSYNEDAAMEKNFDSKIKKLRSILNIWKMRQLTLAGKILLIKTFGLSQFIYLASVISIPNGIIQKIDTILYDFLWKGGKGFIKRNTLIGNFEDGGAKMVDVKSMFKSLKIKWIQRYVSDNCAAWKEVFNVFIEPYGGKLILHCNVDPKSVKTWKNIPLFYKDVLAFYFEFIKPNEVDVICQCIWNNCKIMVDKRPCKFSNNLYRCGMNLVSDLYTDDGNIIQFESWLIRGVPKSSFLQWRSIVAAIPTQWKEFLKRGFKREHCVLSGFIMNEGDINFDNVTTKSIYQILIHRFLEPPTSQRKYGDEFDIDTDCWKSIYMLPFRCSGDIRTQMFQYKINLRCLMTKDRLYKMKIVNDNLCSLCNQDIETMKHLFFECDKVNFIWSDFQKWWNEVTGNEVDLNFESIMFGVNYHNPDVLLNLCIIIIKRMVYTCKFSSHMPCFVYFKKLLKFHYDLEKQIALNNNTLYKHTTKWRILQETL